MGISKTSSSRRREAIGRVPHRRRATVSSGDVDHVGAEKRIEQRVGAGARGRLAVHHQHGPHAQLHRRRRRDSRVVGLHAAGRDERGASIGLRFRAEQGELTDFVAAEREADGVVALDEESGTAAEPRREVCQRLNRRRQRREHQRRNAAERRAKLSRRHSFASPAAASAWKQIVTAVPAPI